MTSVALAASALVLLAAAGALSPAAARGDEAATFDPDARRLDPQGLIQSMTPAPAAEGIVPSVAIELRLAVEPLRPAPDEEVWLRVAGNLSGPRTPDESALAIEPALDFAGALVRFTTTRPFLAGEEVRFVVRSGVPLADGRELRGLASTFRIAPAAGRGGFALGVDDPWLPPTLFESVQRLDVGMGPNMVVAADFNRDGAVDLAVSEVLGDDSIYLFLNNQTGRLIHDSTYQIGDLVDPGRFAAGDVNGDGWLDLVVVGQKSANLVVLTGQPDGGFAVATPIDLGIETPVHVAVADLDLDGHDDVLVAHLAGDAISLLRGDPEAESGLAEPVRVAALPGLQTVAVADFNGDLRPDLALVSEETSVIGLLIGTGATAGAGPLFEASLAMPTGRRPESLVTGDLNNDGRTDLAVTHAGSNEVAVFLGRGDGSFDSPLVQPVGDRPVVPALADFDADGDLDLAVPNLLSDDVMLLMGAGDGTFESVETLPVDAGPVAVAAADFDRDGDIDLAVVSSVGDNVSVYFNRGVELSPGSAVDEPRSLAQNIPNPFNPNTTITYTLLKPNHVNLVVFNTSGKIVRTLVDDRRPSGQHSAFWDGTDEVGERVPSGIYFYRLTTDDAVELRRMTLLR